MSATTPIERLTYTPREAAAMLGVSRTTVYEWMREGTIPSAKVGGCRLIRRGTLEQMLADLEGAGR